MKCSVPILVVGLGLFSGYFACKTAPKEEESTDVPPVRLVGGVSPMTEEEMQSPIFQEALAEVLKQLDGNNKCHSFQLVKVVKATKQIVAGTKYIMELELTPIFESGGDPECSTACYSALEGNKVAKASIVVQPWNQFRKFQLSFTINRDNSGDFDGRGNLIVSCGNGGFTRVSSMEMDGEDFENMVESAMEKLNKEASKCFRFLLQETYNGQKKTTPRTEYKWDMAVKKLYEENTDACRGHCADDCTHDAHYEVSGYMEDGNPHIMTLSPITA